ARPVQAQRHPQPVGHVDAEGMILREVDQRHLAAAGLRPAHEVFLDQRKFGRDRIAGGTIQSICPLRLTAALEEMVGVAGFEPTTLCPPDKCATRLRYTPT